MLNQRLRKAMLVTGTLSSILLGCTTEKISAPIEKPKQEIPKNHNPIINSSPVTKCDENFSYTYEIKATDSDGDLLNYNFEGPSWLSVSHNFLYGICPEVSEDQSIPIKVKVSDGKGGTDEQSYTLFIRNLFNTHVFSQNEINNISSVNDSDIVFSNPVDFSVNDIVASNITDKTPYGMLREVASVSSDKKKITTKQAALEQIAKNTSLSYSQILNPSQISSSSSLEGISLSSTAGSAQDFSFNLNLNNVVLYDSDGNQNTTQDQLIANGNISFDTDLLFNLNLGNKKILDFGFRNVTDVNSDITLGFNSLGIASLTNIKLAEYKFNPILMGYVPTIIPVPVIVVPVLGIYVGIDPVNLNPLSVRVGQDAHIDFGMIYDGNNFNWIHDFSNDFNFSNPVTSGNLELKAYAGPTLEARLYGVAGPFASVSGRLRLETNNNEWKLYGGLGVSAGVKMEVLRRGISAQFRNLISQEWLLAESGTSETNKIMFVSGPEFTLSPDDYPKIYTINDDGSDLQQLTNFEYNGFSGYEPISSPDRTRIAYVSNQEGNLEIYTMNFDGTGITRLTNNSNSVSNDDISPDWSPDGSEIVFVSNRSNIQNKSHEVYIMNADGSNQRKLEGIPSNILEHGFPRWSPDGQYIAFDATETGSDFDIYVVNKNGTGLFKLVNSPYLDIQSSWSPDGTKLAYVSSRDGNREIYLINSNGTNETRLTNNSADDTIPFWSPDGKKIIFISKRDSGYNHLHIMDSDGSNVRRINTIEYNNDQTPSYLPPN